ncbi:hypothetical protein EMCRGX_G032049 [Ephydatia muelleri]
MTDKLAPDSRLQLEWVYGYRGHQCRNNLYYNANGEVVYFVAGTGIVLNAAERKQRFFLGHSDDIISLALHPAKALVATGQIGKNPFVCVWDTVSLETVSLLQGGHERGVAALAFSGDGTLLASVGMDDNNTVCVWDWQKGKVIASARGHSDRIFDIQFNPTSKNSLVTCGVKHIKFWTLCGNSLTGQKGIFGKKGELQTILCATFSADGSVYTGTLNGEIYKWEGHTLQSVIKGAHQGSIYSIHSTTDGFATASKDGSVGLWDPRFELITRLDLTKVPPGYKGMCVRSVCWGGEKILAGTKDSEVFEIVVQDKEKPIVLVQGHAEGELWALAVHPKKALFATGSDDKTIRVWSLVDRTMVACHPMAHAVRSLAYSPDASQLSAGLQDGSFVVLNTKDLSEVVHIKNCKEVLHEMKYSPDGNYLAVGSNDNFVDIYSVSQGYKYLGRCSGSSSFITHLDWSVDSTHIQTNSGASERLYYQVPTCKRVTAKEEIQGIQWATWTGVLGTEVHGIWPKYSQLNDVNATDASFEHNTIATGDDFGLVKLFRFPSVKKGANFKKYVGHSAHVTNVRFSADKHHLITLGGGDHAIFQWRFIPDGQEAQGGAGEEESETAVVGGATVESDSEVSDSEISDVSPVDSDVEGQQEKSYDRAVYREDIQLLKEKLRSKEQEVGEEGKKAGQGEGKKVGQGEGKKVGQGEESTSFKDEVPPNSLSLQFVHGYRGYDCRSNLYYTRNGEIVYHIAAVGIVYNKNSHRQRFYLLHTDDILCLAIHPSQDCIATGQIGRDPSIHIWDANSMQTLSILKGEHSRGVCAVDFSADGKKLASVGLDDDHCIVVWNWSKGEKLATTRGHKDKIFMIKWDPHSQDQLVTVGVKHIKFWTQAGGGFTSKRGIFGKVEKIDTMLCVVYGTTGGVVFSGGADGKVYHWSKSALTTTVDAHKGPVYVLGNIEKGFLSGGKDGLVILWDEQFKNRLKSYQIVSSGLVEGSIKLFADFPPIKSIVVGDTHFLVGTKNSEVVEIDKNGPIKVLIQGHMEGEVWGLATHPDKHICATVSDDKTLRVWDLQGHKMVAVRELGKEGRSVGYSPVGNLLAVGMLDGSFSVLDADTLKELATFHHRKAEISDIKFSPNGKYLAVASHNDLVDLYNILTQKRVGICKGASSYITHVDWEENGKLLQINTGDKEVLYFEAPRGKQQFITSKDAEHLTWSRWTSVLGSSCVGIWPAYSDVTDINAACVSRDSQVIATGDDFGFVKLLKYPSKGKHAKYKQYVGHSAHVTNVRFTHDDTKLVSTGGGDLSVMVWSHSKDGTQKDTLDYISDDSNTDSEEEGGYDSDVERDKRRDYTIKTYANPIRDGIGGTKPHLQEAKPASGEKKPTVSRNIATTPIVACSQTTVGVKDLTLEYIFGYRGFDTHQNLLYTADGSIIWHAAGAGIVFDPLTKKQSFYLEHNDDIICLAVCSSPTLSNVVATGQIGKSAIIHVWDYYTKETLSILHGAHPVGVGALDFSSSGKFLLSVGVDQKHSIVVWRWAEGYKVAQATGSRHVIFVAKFRPESETKFVTCGFKHVKFWTLAGTQLIGRRGVIPKSVQADLQTMLSVAFASDDVTFTGSVSGDVFVWKGGILSRIVSCAHSGPVFSMHTCSDDGLVVSAGKERNKENYSGAVKVWDAGMSRFKGYSLGEFSPACVRSVCRTKGKVLVGTENGEVLEVDEKNGSVQALIRGHMEGELWGLATSPTDQVFVSASDDRTVRLWDIASKTLLRLQKLDHPIRSADFSPDGSMVAVGMTNGEFVLLLTKDFSIVAKKRDRSKTIQAIRFSPLLEGKFSLAVGSDDAAVDIYSISPTYALVRMGYCRDIPSVVTHMDWSTDGKYMQVSTGVYEKLICEVLSGKVVTDSSVVSRIVWSSWTSVLGNEVIGIWPQNADKADINTAHLCNSGTAVATGDDFGTVKLFDHFPITEKYAGSRSYYGHSAHVTNVKFTHDDQYLISAGGDDSCVFVWKCQ